MAPRTAPDAALSTVSCCYYCLETSARTCRRTQELPELCHLADNSAKGKAYFHAWISVFTAGSDVNVCAHMSPHSPGPASWGAIFCMRDTPHSQSIHIMFSPSHTSPEINTCWGSRAGNPATWAARNVSVGRAGADGGRGSQVGAGGVWTEELRACCSGGWGGAGKMLGALRVGLWTWV